MNWQDYFALLLFVIAAIVVLARAYRFFVRREASGCGTGCGTCPSNQAAGLKAKSLLSIGSSPKDAGPSP